MTAQEVPCVFDCNGDRLLGIMAIPEQPKRLGILILVGGPQYRAGSHRQFVLLSRALADTGFPVMRFDYRGMGDSSGEQRNFENVEQDIAAALEAFFKNCPSVSGVVLWGLCDAASASLMYWYTTRDQRIKGMVLLNPWVRSEASLAKTRLKHYYGRRLLQAEFWRKVMTGKFSMILALAEFLGNLGKVRKNGDKSSVVAKDFRSQMLHALETCDRLMLLILSGDDYTAKEFLETVASEQTWANALGRKTIRRIDIVDADHTFSSENWRSDVEAATKSWLESSDHSFFSDASLGQTFRSNGAIGQ